MNSILIRSTMLLGLSVASGAVLAQTEAPQKPLEQTQPAESGAAVPTEPAAGAEGGTAASTETQPAAEAESDAAATPKTQPPAAEATTQGEAAQKLAGQADAEPAADEPGAAEAATDAPAEGEEQGTAQDASSDEDNDQDKAGSLPDVNVTVEQTTEIREVIRESNVKPVADIDFDISVGIAVPRTVEFYTLPPRIVKIVPAYEGYRYFVLADGRIVIVEPQTYEIVYILT